MRHGIITMVIGIAMVTAGFIGLPSGSAVSHAHAAQSVRLSGHCRVHVSFATDSYGHAEALVSGRCHGHAPTDAEVRHYIRVIFGMRTVPAWLHIGRTGTDDTCNARAILVWGGNGDTSALICRNGRAYIS